MTNQAIALSLLQAVIGLFFIFHGYPKIFKGFVNFKNWIGSLGFRPPLFWAVVAAGVEFFGGIMLVLGIWVQAVGVLIAVQMFVAMWKVKWGKTGFMDPGGWELDFLYLVSGITLAISGGGYFLLKVF